MRKNFSHLSANFFTFIRQGINIMKRIVQMMVQGCFPFLCLAFLVACNASTAHPQKSTSTEEKTRYVSISQADEKLHVPPSKMITLPYNNASPPIVLGQEMYVAVNTKWGDMPNEIRKINLDTKKEMTIFQTEYHPSTINDLQENGTWLVWVDSTEEGFHNNIWVKNLKTGEMKKIYQQPEYSRILIIPTLYDHYVAWSYEKNDKVKMCLMDLDTGKKEDVAEHHTFSLANYAHIDPINGKLLWTDSENGVGYFKVLDIKTRQITTYPLPGYTPGYASFVGDNDLLFLNSTDNFVKWENPPNCIYHLKTKQYQILSDDEHNRNFDSLGDRIFYINDEGVQLIVLKNGQFEREKIPHQLKDPEFIYIANNHLILEKGNEKDGRGISVTFEIIDLTQVK
jgi:hypothetical protein